MPHLIVEYSANLADEIAIPDLLRTLHTAALTCPTMDQKALRTRGERREDIIIADGNPDHLFAMVTARILAGRLDDLKQTIADTLFAALQEALSGIGPERGLALAVDIVEIAPETFRKNHNLDTIAGVGQAAQ
ncbi:MAG: hypothetical protein P8Q36_07710 [Alphaproteobacteria bacterium]|jgi:5-carboxymethyl-2-hydroxymuconate isomerase|nr:hypothetical protein [Rhodospirillaceae bacterium]MDG2480740.1 hypothetical protein [Alphaproteobacteria bacterium]MBT6205170.1 hypothetical protein [Rhodospirillaceae bacterium]MBT6510652.1 hypothetical protein [Rhodospirillaceae bacterium]MBT7611851.1 hypothetical protein [Rhodospirillaceae bacterium]